MSKEFGNTPADKDYKPSGISRAEEVAWKKYPMYLAKAVMSDGNTIDLDANETTRNVFKLGYEQAEKDINREMLDRMNEIREKQTKAALEDLNYTIKIDPALGFDEGSAVVYHGKEIISVLTWEDLELLYRLFAEEENNFSKHDKYFYTEVLTRYKQYKEEKQ